MRSLKFFIITLMFLQFINSANSSDQLPTEGLQEPDLTRFIPLPENAIDIQTHEIDDVVEYMKEIGIDQFTTDLTESFLLLQDQSRKARTLPTIKKNSVLFQECLCSKLSNFIVELNEFFTILCEIETNNIKNLNQISKSYIRKSQYCTRTVPALLKNKSITMEQASAMMGNLNNLGKSIVNDRKELEYLSQQIRWIAKHIDYINQLIKELNV